MVSSALKDQTREMDIELGIWAQEDDSQKVAVDTESGTALVGGGASVALGGWMWLLDR